MTAITRSIDIRTEIPGPRSREIVARREAAVPTGLYKAHQIAVDHAAGALVTDVDGNTFIDFVGGIGVLNAGHCPPEVVAAIQAQAAKLIHFSALVGTYEPYVELCERINAAVPIAGPCKTILSNSGAEGVENAIKFARAATGRQAIVAFEGGYHGRTLMTLSLTSKTSFKKSFGPFAPEIYRAPFPAAYRMGLSESAAVERCWEAFERMLVAGIGPEAIAGVIIEPVQGEGGFIPVPAEFMRRLRAFCTHNGSLLIADEVQCGFGRTGTLFASEQLGVEPDILVSAKSIAAGMPLAATTGRAELLDKAHVGGIGGTYGGNPLACVAAIEVIKWMQQPGALERAHAIGQAVRERAAEWQRAMPQIGDVRGMGAMIALELVASPATRAPAADEVLAVVKHCADHGLLTMRAGLYANCLRLLMPLTITDDQLQEGLDVLEDGLRAVIE
ncbi:MAG: aspartate aminotransferase family protein [Kouleothrix sp.]|jgi:4-aminobutyrate aminotransferase/(S)-3-amino-2-methylpropionate transaminase|nr:aspartate aminotransferase family protein [Kouleothrix sp.]